MSRLAYDIVDVFTDRPFTGNPLAVVFGGDDLDSAQMLTLAREFHLSETVFLLPTTAPGAGYRARIFTPAAELPFAGHPSIGAAVVAVAHGLCQPDAVNVVIQECGIGLLPIEVSDTSARVTGGQPRVGPPLDPAPLLAMLGLPESALAGPPPRLAGCGLDFVYLAVAPDAVAAAEMNTAQARQHGAPELSVFSWDVARQTAHARVFCPGAGVPEDPATGSAALGLGAYLVAAGLLPEDGESRYLVRQGAELRRPSLLDATITARDGAATVATVAGGVVPIASGHIATPPFVG
ncbi:PhzF family phenazine biosynthesis protein [Pilimelia columellifera]|uniref:PhzF family phenazine biosynthesis protein n=1 Tax=Pilimelia columellifera subsp. columellifera TaxID=706583 RepID=A0ABN3NGI7_9ACTN